MPLPAFDELFAAADRRPERIRIAAAGAADRTVLEAVMLAQRRGWIDPILVGQETQIRECAQAAAISLEGMRIVDAEQSGTAAVAEVRAGRADTLMKGQVNTPDLIRAVLNGEQGLRTGKTLCQVVFMEISTQSRRFLLSDTGLCIEPNFRQKSEILDSLIQVAHGLGVSNPRIAVMSASEKVSPAMPDTVEADELQRLNAAGEFPGSVVQGPLSFDLAYAADAGDKKRIGGQVVGAADAMLFPNLLSANLTVKGIMYTSDCRFGGVVCGAACPIVFMSRADTTATRLNSLALAVTLVAAGTWPSAIRP